MVLSMILFFLMVVCSGMAVDLMRYENTRTGTPANLGPSHPGRSKPEAGA